MAPNTRLQKLSRPHQEQARGVTSLECKPENEQMGEGMIEALIDLAKCPGLAIG